MSLVTRVLRERRSVIIPLTVALAINVLVFLLVVRPMAVRSAGAADRAGAAAAALRIAERERTLAQQLVDGKARADEALDAFYGKVLPADLTAARRMTYSSLPALAKRTNVVYETRRFETPDSEKDARLGRLAIRMVLQGEYEDIRRFVYELERAPEFVIIDGVTLTEGADNELLTLRLDLSTYYTLRSDGS
ncbi:MAG: GspMb/PilO family protein [Vicinamibacterales bacterium]